MDYAKEKQFAAFLSICSNAVLITLKLIVGFLTGSLSITSEALHSLSDIAASFIAFISVKKSSEPADEEHPFGHGRVEYITSLVIAVIILVAGGSAIYESILSLINKTKAEYTNLTLIIVSIAIVGKVALGLFFTKMAKKTNSDALKGSGIDALFDALLSTATLIGAIIAMYTNVYIEGYLGIIIGLFIIKSGVGILRDALSNIIGERTSKEVALAIKQTVNSFPEVKGSYDLILNNYGPTRAIGSIHIEVDDNLTAKEIHPLSRKIAQEVYLKYGVILTVGIYATNSSNPRIKEIKKDVHDLMKEYKNIQQIHGFYVDEKLKIVSFDIVIDFDEEHPDQLVEQIKDKLKEKYQEYNFAIVVDNDFTD